MSKMGWFGVKVIENSDRAHTSFYEHSVENMSLSCTVSEIERDIGRKAPTLGWCR